MNAPLPPQLAASLCSRCARMRAVATAHSTFLRCTEPGLPRYPRQPVVLCSSFEEAPPPKASDPD